MDEPQQTKLRHIAIVLCAALVLGCAVYFGWYSLQSRKMAGAQAEAAQRYVLTEPTEETTVPPTAEETKPTETTAPTEPEDPYGLPKIDFEALWETTENVKAWIQIPALGVDYPVCWNHNDLYYLDRTWDDQQSIYGAIFLEEENTPSFSDPYQVIYGHNMTDGTMFGSFKKYASRDFYEENGGRIYIFLPKENRVYEIFSVEYVSSIDTTVYSVNYEKDSERYGEALARMKAQGIYPTEYKVSAKSRVITLSTCATGDDRLVLHAVMVDRLRVKK